MPLAATSAAQGSNDQRALVLTQSRRVLRAAVNQARTAASPGARTSLGAVLKAECASDSGNLRAAAMDWLAQQDI